MRSLASAIPILLLLTLMLPVSSGSLMDADTAKEDLLRASARISDVGISAAREMLLRAFEENITEADVVKYIEKEMIAQGSSDYIEAFGVMVASGVDSSLPHGDSSNDETNQILPGEVVVVDLGARYRGYCTDITRTFFMGEPTQEMKDIYNITLEAQLAAIDNVRSGKKASEIDKVARDIITGYGYGENFTHGLGHGIGVYIHMPPTLSPSSRGVLAKASDMAITIEPGIYLEDRWGVRIEDDILVTWISYERITHSPKKLEDAILRMDGEHVVSAEGQFKEPSDPENNTITFILAVLVIGTVGMIAIPVYMKFFRKK